MSLLHNNDFDNDFSQIENIRSYPYVGKNFGCAGKRILVFAHNIYCSPDKYESEKERTKEKLHYANSMNDYTYCNEDWTQTFRNFVKSSVGLKSNYSKNSGEETIQKIKEFIEGISYTNYINDLLPSAKANNINVELFLIKSSNSINLQLIRTLKVSHIVCWGKQVFNYLLSMPECTIQLKTSHFEVLGDIKSRSGFAFAKIHINQQTIFVLKIFHPSMPGFGPYNPDTQKILNWFYTQQL